MKQATLVFIINDNKVLLGEKKRGEIGTGTLNGPGGKREGNESLMECAVRETYEELGVTLQPSKLKEVAVVTFYADGIPDFEVYVYRTHQLISAPIETDDMIPEWYLIDDLPFERMLESDRAWVSRALKDSAFKANVYYKKRAKDFDRIEFEDD